MPGPAVKPPDLTSIAGPPMEAGPGGNGDEGRQEDDDEFLEEGLEEMDDEATIDQEEALAATEGADAKVILPPVLPTH